MEAAEARFRATPVASPFHPATTRPGIGAHHTENCKPINDKKLKAAEVVKPPTERQSSRSARSKEEVELVQLPAVPAKCDKVTKQSDKPQVQRALTDVFSATKGGGGKSSKKELRQGYM